MFTNLWRKLFRRDSSLSKLKYSVNLVATNPTPKEVPPGQIIVVGSKAYQKWAYLRCPCKCGEIIMLSLSKTTRPNWAVTVDRQGRPTVFPSVRQTAGCLSHFWIRGGVVNWCEDTGHVWTLDSGR